MSCLVADSGGIDWVEASVVCVLIDSVLPSGTSPCPSDVPIDRLETGRENFLDSLGCESFSPSSGQRSSMSTELSTSVFIKAGYIILIIERV
jgi:hypothetical protein